MSTTLKVTHALKEKLKTLKAQLKAKSAEDVILHLLTSYQDEDAAIGSGSDSGSDMQQEDDDEPRGKLEQGLFHEALGEDHKAVKHFTGLKWEAYEWVRNALRDVVCESPFSPPFALSLLACPHLPKWRLFMLQSIDLAHSDVQHNSKQANGGGGRRASNEGYRALDIDDRIFLFLIRLRRRMPFETIGILFGISHDTAHRYYRELLAAFCENVVARLLFPLSKEETVDATPEDFRRDLPDILVIWDATGFKLKSKEDVLLSKLLWSEYHHQSEAFVVFGTCKAMC